MATQHEGVSIPKQSPEEQSEEAQRVKDAYEEAQKKWRVVGRLGVTGADHWAIGGSPPLKLDRNPGKTEADLMTDEELLEWLQKGRASLESARERFRADPKDDWAKGDIPSAKKELKLAISYLASIGRLPKEFSNFQAEDLPDDPKEK